MEHYTIEKIRKDISRERGEEFTDDQFTCFVGAFITYAVKRGLYSKDAVYKAVRRGWMTATMAYFFKRYVLG